MLLLFNDRERQEIYMIGVELEQAVSIILEEIKQSQAIERVPLLQANGRILASDMIALFPSPIFHRSAIDGYAVLASDTKGASFENPVVLKVVEEVCAGHYPKSTLKSGQAVRIMTGAPFPENADSAVRQENTDYGEDLVAIFEEVKVNENFCFCGEDYKQGDTLIHRETKVSYIEQGILASMGCDYVAVYQRPRIALITTGDETVAPGLPLSKGKIYNSNLTMIYTRLQEFGLAPFYAEQVEDDVGKLAEQIKRLADRSDLILTTGGVSVGKKDIVHDTLKILNCRQLFWKILMKPGTPVLCSIYHNTPIISLSGNPFAAIANVELLVRPVLAKMSRDNTLLTQSVQAVMDSDFNKVSIGRRFIRACCENGLVRLPNGLHSSGVIGSMIGCNCLIDIPEGNQGLKKGDCVCVVML